MWISSALILSLFVGAAPDTKAADEALQKSFQQYLDEEFARHPLDATRNGDHRFDHLLDDVSPTARAAWPEQTKATLAGLAKIDPKTLSRAAQIDLEIFKHSLEYQLWSYDNVHPFEEDPRTYGAYITESVFLPLTQSTLPKATNIRNAAARMAQLPKIVAAAKASLKNPPKPILETAISQNRGAIAFYERGVFDLVDETPQLSELKAPATAAVAVLRDYQTFLESELLPKANGEWRLGREKFSQKLELELDAGLKADEVLAEAEAEFQRVRRDMHVIARQSWARLFPKRALPPDDAAGRADTIRAVIAEVSKQHGKPEDLVKDAKATVERIKEFIARVDLLRLPTPDRCQIIEMPEFQRGNPLAYLNPAPPLDPKAASIYAVSPPPKDWSAARVNSFLEEYNRHMLQILTIHEGYPGHYVQLEYSNRHPSFIRKILSSGVFAEGWAVYTEQTMLDQGYGDGDLALRMNQLKFYLRAVVNTILDHKMHCANMTDDEALALLMQEAFQSEGEAKLKIIRAKQSSCQLSTYFVGRMAFYRLRQSIEREQGDQFNLGRYHEAVLDHGTLPVKYLPELVRERLKAAR